MVIKLRNTDFTYDFDLVIDGITLVTGTYDMLGNIALPFTRQLPSYIRNAIQCGTYKDGSITFDGGRIVVTGFDKSSLGDGDMSCVFEYTNGADFLPI